MTSGTSGAEYQTLKQSVGSSNDWQSSAQQLRQQAQGGQIPESYSQIAQTIEQNYQNSDAQTQQALEKVPSDAKASFYHFAGAVSQMNPQDRQKVSQFLTKAIQETAQQS